MSQKYELLRSLTTDSVSESEAKVTGQVPEWLEGSLFRNGPGRYELGNKHYNHLFDGLACLNKFEIKNGKIFYSNKFIKSNHYKQTLAENRLYPVFGTIDVCSNIFERVKTMFTTPQTLDNVNINIVPFSNQHLYALTETNFICRIDPKTLEVIDHLSVTDFIKTSKTSLAHPHVLTDGSWINMGINTSKPGYDFIKYESSKSGALLVETGKLITTLPSSHTMATSYFHSFGLTENYIIFLEQSLKLSFKELIKGLVTNKPFSNALKMNPNFDTKIHLINRHTGEVISKKYYTEPIFVFHHINAYENQETKEILVDVCAYNPNYFKIEDLLYENFFTDDILGSNKIKSIARRITIPLHKSSSEPIYCNIKDLNADVVFELPAINYSRSNGRKYKYVYGANYFKKPFSIIKLNVDNPTEVIEMKYEERNILPSEPVFVERPNAVLEDDGVVLVMCLADGNDYLSILDAKNLTEIARGDLSDQIKAGFTFHGFFADVQNFKQLN